MDVLLPTELSRLVTTKMYDHKYKAEILYSKNGQFAPQLHSAIVCSHFGDYNQISSTNVTYSLSECGLYDKKWEHDLTLLLTDGTNPYFSDIDYSIVAVYVLECFKLADDESDDEYDYNSQEEPKTFHAFRTERDPDFLYIIEDFSIEVGCDSCDGRTSSDVRLCPIATKQELTTFLAKHCGKTNRYKIDDHYNLLK